MLVLARKIGEQLLINDNVVISVIEVKGSKVRIGIEAPKSVRVMRMELVQRDAAASEDGDDPRQDVHDSERTRGKQA